MNLLYKFVSYMLNTEIKKEKVQKFKLITNKYLSTAFKTGKTLLKLI